MRRSHRTLFLLLLAFSLVAMQAAPALAADAQAFDLLWAELMEAETSQRKPLLPARDDEFLGTGSAADAEIVTIGGEILEQRALLPATDTPWHLVIDDVVIADYTEIDPELLTFRIKNVPLGEGSVYVVGPSDFIEHGGGITWDPFSNPPQIKVTGGTAAPIRAAQLTLHIEAPIDSIRAKGFFPLHLSEFRRPELELILDGKINLHLDDARLEHLNLLAQGSGAYKLSGEADYAAFDLAGSMRMEAGDLHTDKLFARLNGPLHMHCGNGVRSILDLQGGAEITPPSGEIIRLDD